MKSNRNEFAVPLLVMGLTVVTALSSQAQITVKVDSTKSWAGYMNVYDTNSVYQWGSGWGLPDLRAAFLPAKSNATRVVLQLNTNLYNPADSYWNLPDGTPNKIVEANFYVDAGTAYEGQDVTFEGVIESNTIPAGWNCEAVIKEFRPGYAYVGLTPAAIQGGSPFSVFRPIAAGNIVQYGFLIYGPHVAPGSADAAQAISAIVDNADPSILAEPVNQRVAFGGTASFSVAATGGSLLSYQWMRYSTNILNQPGKFAGATSATLTISNAQAEDATTYSVQVTDTAGSVTPPAARLRVLGPAQLANALDNPSFEEDYVTFFVVPDPWVNFSGSGVWSTPDWPYGSPVDGTNVVQVYNAAEWNGFYQDVPASPGDIFTGDIWLYQSVYEPLSAPTNVAYLEVQFRHGNDNPIAIYNSIFITNSPDLQDQWLFLPATNGVAAGYSSTTTSNATYLVAPPGTDHVRFQVTLHNVGGGSGSLYVDSARLMKKIPVTVTPTRNGPNLNLSWQSQGATDYQVVYKDSLDDLAWTPLGAAIPGDGSVKSTSVAIGNGQRFYSVLTK